MFGAGFTCGWLVTYRSSQLRKGWPGAVFLIIFAGSLAVEAYLFSGLNALTLILASLMAGGATETVVRNLIRNWSRYSTEKEGRI